MKAATLLISATILATGCQQKLETPASISKQNLPEFLVTTLVTAPGWSVVETKGYYCSVFQYQGTGDYLPKFNQAIAGIHEKGKEGGSNALVNFRVSSESHEIQGSKWHASIVHLCGDLVTLK